MFQGTNIVYVEPPGSAPLTLDDIQSALFLICIGVILSLITFAQELLRKNLCSKKTLDRTPESPILNEGTAWPS